MIKLKRTLENKCSVLITTKLDDCDLDLLDTFGLINEKEIKSTENDPDAVSSEIDIETILVTILNRHVSKKLSSKTGSSRELFLRFIYENMPDCLTYNFKNVIPDAIIIQKDYIIAHEQNQGVRHLKQLFPKLYSQHFDVDRESSYYLGPLTTKDGVKGVILIKSKNSFMLNTFSVFHEWGHHLYAQGLMTKEHKKPCVSYKYYRYHFGKSSWEEKRCDWYAIKTIYEIYGPGYVMRTLDKMNEKADSRMSEYPFVDTKYRVKLMCRLTRRYLKGC